MKFIKENAVVIISLFIAIGCGILFSVAPDLLRALGVIQ